MSFSGIRRRVGRLAISVAAVAITAAPIVTIAASASPAASAAKLSCPTTINASQFASAAQLRLLNAKLASFGLRSPGSDSQNREIAWLQSEFRKIPGIKLSSESFSLPRWQPLATSAGQPGRDLAKSGGLRVAGAGSLPIMDPVPYSLPTSSAGKTAPLTYIPNDQDITSAKAKGKIVVRDVKTSSLAYALFGAIAEYLAPGLPSTGDYVRPYLDPLDGELIAAGKAGAAGLIIVWNAPGSQLRGYFDPHTGTRFRVPAVYVGNEQGGLLKQAAQSGRSATVTVRAKWDVARTRNIFATLRGRSRQRIIVLTHTDGATWVQENGSVGEIALARYLARLPLRCRERDVQFALTSGHLSFAHDGTDRYSTELDRDYDKGTVAFGVTLEHLGTKEILPRGANSHLVLTGKPETIAWSAAQESPVLVQASIAAVKRRKLTATAVLKGVGAPVNGQAPSVCSYGGIGTYLNQRLIPSIATITGPWSLWAPSFGSTAIDFTRMRNEVIAQGDVIRQLDSVPRATIAGQFTAERQQRAKGQVNTCSLALPPAVAPAH